MTIAQAANRLGISENAVRQRIKRGTLEAAKVDGIWQVSLPDHEPDQEATTGRDHQAGYQGRPAGDYQATRSDVVVSDAARAQLAAIRDEFVQPLVDQIAAQAEQIGRLSAERDALQVELDRRREQDTTPRVATQDDPGAPIAEQRTPGTLHPTAITLGLRVRRWLRRMTGGEGG